MLFSTLAAATFLAASASAYTVLTPTLNSTITKGSTINVKWTSVDTDADVFSIYITNFATHHWPPTVLSLAQNVPRDDGSIDIRIPGTLSADYGWQINFINGTNTYVIYAQSKAFSLIGPDVADPTTTSPAPYPHYTGYSNTTVSGTPVTVHVTSTATLCKAVETVVYETPIVWFVEPSKEAVCDMPAKETVTVTVTPGHGGVPSYTGPAHGEPTSAHVETHVPVTSGHVAPTGTGGYIMPTGPAEFTGAASSVRVGGAAALIIGAVAFLL